MQQYPLLPPPACRYPLIVKDVIEEEPRTNGDGEEVPVNTAEPNPNGVELDNLYLVSLFLICTVAGYCVHAAGRRPCTAQHQSFWGCSPAGGCCHLYVASTCRPSISGA